MARRGERVYVTAVLDKPLGGYQGFTGVVSTTQNRTHCVWSASAGSENASKLIRKAQKETEEFYEDTSSRDAECPRLG